MRYDKYNYIFMKGAVLDMEDFETLHLLFMEGDIYYLLPVSTVGEILDGREERNDFSVIDFSKLTDNVRKNGSDEKNYIIEIKDRRANFGLSVETVIGLQSVGLEDQVQLDKIVLNSNNQFLKKAVWLENERVWAFLLEPSHLSDTSPGDIGSEKRVLVPKKVSDLEALEFIVIECEEQKFYAEKRKIEGIVMRPVVQRVPKASEEIRGISEYQGRMVIYYNLDNRGTEEGIDYECGVIMKEQSGIFLGIYGNITKEYKGSLEKCVSVAEGIWEKNCD